MKSIPDQIYIEQLRNRLWTNREIGRAAIMVGAGFSRNAEIVSPAASLFTLWAELTRAMEIELYPSAYKNKNQSKDALRLATEYESVFGRDALNSLIRRTIPDDNYKPGRLHRMLLSLPWSDVFTTNYDTLLERTLPEIHDRKYDLILTLADLPARIKPRIIKLHGSFPSYLPFIITQEDFRTFPREFAPFVNTVQQSIVENAFCMIGFSGEDPNFLNWIGWVRDNFGNSTPPIYLCSLFEISPSERRVLEKRNVFPIDLSNLISKTEIPDDNLRFAKMLEWFLLELWNGAPLNNLSYPKLERQSRWTASHGVPSLIVEEAEGNDLGQLSPIGVNANLSETELKQICFRWKSQRQKYPGWVVLPTDNQELLWKYTENWINPIFRSLKNLPAPEDLSIIFELNWRFEKCLLPLPGSEATEKWTEAVSKYNPFPTLVLKNAEFQPNNDAGGAFNWSEISEQWVHLNFALMREAREQLNTTKFEEFVEFLREIVKQKEDWQSHWFYERCLFALFRFDHSQARKILSEWSKDLGGTFWQVKRASILAEIGEIKAAEELAESALASIRSRQQPFTHNYALFSQEGWTMLLLKGLKDDQLFVKNKNVGEYQDRWERLGRFRCNPWLDLEKLELTVKALDPHPKPFKTVKKGFSSNTQTISYSIASDENTKKIRLSLSFLRLYEEAALPFRSNKLIYFSEAITNAALCLANLAPEKTISTIVRIEKTDDINSWFQQHHVANLTEELVARFFVIFTNSFVEAAKSYQKSLGSDVGETSLRRINFYAELLSRLCFRLTKRDLETVLAYALEIYKLPIFAQNLFLHDSVNVLIKRCLTVFSSEDILNKIVELLELPIPSDSGFEVAEPQQWGEPFDSIKWSKNFKIPDEFDRTDWNTSIENLLRIAKNGVRVARDRAISRLRRLYQIQGLTPDEEAEFAAAIWARTDNQTHLPAESNFPIWFFLSALPNPNLEETKRSVHTHLLSQNFPRIIRNEVMEGGGQAIGVGIGSGRNYLIEDIIQSTPQPYFTDDENERLIDWTEADLSSFLEKAITWWNAEKQYLKQSSVGQDMIDDTLRRHFRQLSELFAIVLLPRLINISQEKKEEIITILSEMQSHNVFPFSVLPTRLYIAPDEMDKVSLELLKGLRSTEEILISDASVGVFKWLFFAKTSKLLACPPILLDELVNIVALRRQPALVRVLNTVTSISERTPEAITENHRDSLLMALDFLKNETGSKNLTDQSINLINPVLLNEDLYELKEVAQRLAKSLKSSLETAGLTIPEILTYWETLN